MKSEIEVPDGWKVKRLDEITTIIISNVDKKINENEIPVSLCNYKDVYDNHYINSKFNFKDGTAKNEEIKKFCLLRNDVIITKDSETKSDIAIPSVVIEELTNVICGYHLAILRPMPKLLDGIYLMNVLKIKLVNNHFVKYAQGLTRFGLTVDAINRAKIPLPPFEEQQKIADILSKVYEQIDLTEKIIDKTEELKKGLMQKILTKGIGHTKFKKTVFGEIPEEWEIVKIGHLLDDMYSGGTPSTKKETYWNGSIPWMTSVNINSDIEISKGQKNISIDGVENSSTKIVPKDNILFVTRVGLGKVAINKIDIAINQDITGLIVNKNKTDLKYLFWQLYLLSQKIQKKSQGTTIKGILKKDLFNAKIVISDMQEQIKIGNILSKVDEHIQDNKKELKHLQELKKGLMQDLLTGKVRVSV